MADKTQHLGLNLPYGDEFADVALMNENFSTLDTEVFKRVQAVNGVVPDADGNAIVEEVPFARNLVTDQQHESSGAFLMRTTGGSESISDGDANLIGLYGRSTHTGVVHEVLDMTVHSEPRTAGLESEVVDDGITATLDRTTFITKVENPASITVTLTYTASWSENPALYGITVTGVPMSGDSITIHYVRASRGTIVQSNPNGFRSTGWNLYNHSLGYARVIRYSGTYGFLVGGTYTKLEYSETLEGAKTEITVTSGAFTIPGDGYVWVTGGNNTNTYIVMTWSDWGAGPEGGWKIYSESFIDLSTVMGQYFPYGLCAVGAVADQIDVAGEKAVRRIDRIDYTDSAMESIVASGRAYDADTDYIYVVMDSPEVNVIDVNPAYTANDHGMEFIDGGDVAPFVLTLYGENLVDKLRTDIPNKLTALYQDIGKVNAGLSYVENGNTISANANYTEGKFICWKGEIYRVRTTINATVTSSNWTTYLKKQDGIGGALTSINNDLASLNSKITSQVISNVHTWNTGAVDTSSDHNNLNITRFGRIVTIEFQCKIKTDAVNSNNGIAFLPAQYKQITLARGCVNEVNKTSSDGVVGYCGIDSWTQNGSTVNGVYVGDISKFAGKIICGFITYILQTEPT